MLTHIDSILKYALRYYKRQFINRSVSSGKTVSKFNEVLSVFVENGVLQDKGLPSVSQIAERLNMSRRYLSDLLKQETGKTAIELIHLSLINEAKNRLRNQDQTVSEVAYQLGFDNLSYFSKLFKKEVGLSPMEFKKQLLNWAIKVNGYAALLPTLHLVTFCSTAAYLISINILFLPIGLLYDYYNF